MNPNNCRKIILSTATRVLMVLAAVVCALPPECAAQTQTSPMDSIFLGMTVSPAEILTRSQREELLANWNEGKRPANVLNSVYAVSELEVLGEAYLNMTLTPVSRLSLNLLSDDKKKDEKIVVAVYTVGTDSTAPDSDISFYTTSWTPLKTDKFWKTPEVKDFLSKNGDRKADLKKIEKLVPFPTFELTVSPDGMTVSGKMTVGKYLSEEDRTALAPYLVPERIWKWDGRKYRLIDLKKN